MGVVNLLVQLLLLLVATSTAELLQPLTRVCDHVPSACVLPPFLEVETNPGALAHREVVGHGSCVKYRLASLSSQLLVNDGRWLVVSTNSFNVTILADLQSNIPYVDWCVVGIATNFIAYPDQ